MKKYGLIILGNHSTTWKWGLFTIHQLHPSTRPEQTCHKSSLEKKKMADSNPDKSYGWYTAQHFSDYMERVVGEIIIIKLISIFIIFITTLR